MVLSSFFQQPAPYNSGGQHQYDSCNQYGSVGSDTPPRSPTGRSKSISTVSIQVTYSDGETSVLQFLNPGHAQAGEGCPESPQVTPSNLEQPPRNPKLPPSYPK